MKVLEFIVKVVTVAFVLLMIAGSIHGLFLMVDWKLCLIALLSVVFAIWIVAAWRKFK